MKRFSVLATKGLAVAAVAAAMLSVAATPAQAARGTFTYKLNGQTTTLTNPDSGGCYELPGATGDNQVAHISNDTNKRVAVFQDSTSCERQGWDKVRSLTPGQPEDLFLATSAMSVRIWR